MKLGITVRNVETHRSKIMLKLGLHSLAGMIHYAMRNEIISVKGPAQILQEFAGQVLHILDAVVTLK
jgi:Bacterial regulatory proteins, luxR family